MKNYIGKRLLVGISYYDSKDKLTEQIQFHGIITGVNKKVITIKRADTKEDFTLPYKVQPAPKGEYRFKSTGEIVINPDFLVKWEVRNPKSNK
jgi:hypothetical protein